MLIEFVDASSLTISLRGAQTKDSILSRSSPVRSNCRAVPERGV